MKLVYLLIPEGLTEANLTEDQATAVKMVLGEWETLMPRTKPYNGKQVCAAITVDGFDPALMADYGIDWEIIAMWQWSGINGEPATDIVTLDKERFTNYLPDTVEYDNEMNVIATHPPEFHIPHYFGGWTELEGV